MTKRSASLLPFGLPRTLRRRSPAPQRLWEYDQLDLTDAALRAERDAVAAIRDLLVERIDAGWDVDSIDIRADRHQLVFKRPAVRG